MPYFVYILASERNGTLYVGVTNNLVRRVFEHKEGMADGFTKRHGIKTLVYAETHDEIEPAILREKRIKRWKRTWKLELIERDIPNWATCMRRCFHRHRHPGQGALRRLSGNQGAPALVLGLDPASSAG